jgi:CubicO group peptidase (beta-lactamase class C family)
MNQRIETKIPGGVVQGRCDTKFAGVLDAFIANFQQRGEVGASVCLTLDGKTVVDLWGGIADPTTGRLWDERTVCLVYSCTKGATALTAHVAAARGLVELNAPVVRYWPEFGAHGKDRVTLAQMLCHQSAVPVLREKLPQGAIFDWDVMVERLAAEPPHWAPGTRNGYHGLTFGWTVGEPLRRATGKRLGALFHELVAGPLGLDFWIGLPEAEEPRVAPIIHFRPEPKAKRAPFVETLLADPKSIPALFLMNSGGWWPDGANTRRAHAAEIGAANGITNGRGLAQMYQPLARGGGDLVSRDGLARMTEVASATGEDATLLIPTRFALGFMKSMDNRAWRRARDLSEDEDSVLLPADAFGHVGAGGSIGFAAPAAGLSLGYAMNKQGPGLLLNTRGQALVDATLGAVGYRSNAGGAWII